MVQFIDAHRGAYGVEPICAVLPIAPSTYHEQQARQRDPTRGPARARRDAALRLAIQQVWEDSGRRYGSKKVWKELQREGPPVARCTVVRLYRALGLRGIVRGRRARTTLPEPLAHRPQDLVQRDFTATRPNQSWVADLTYVATWRGFVYVAFVTDACSRRIVGWRATSTLRTDLALDALEQALYDRELDGPLTHHSDRGSQGEFNRSSQHLDGEVSRWRRGVDDRVVRSGLRCGPPAVRQPVAASVGSGSGTPSRADCRARMRRGRPECPPLLGRAGFASMVGWRRSLVVPSRGASCRSASAKRSPSYVSVGAVFVRSPASSVDRHRRSPARCVAMPRPGAAAWSTAPRPRNGTLTGAPDARRWRSSR